ncbi:hypothetical protein ACRALDRAFT_1062195 [Sodiomyces alcalophilus JCM 7366]|uniref:uncharacterized protein n=1 Tax=Sodiomyces alcalophilus JCM 7366 TaxID=591952 RepID=UPI0039B4EE5B
MAPNSPTSAPSTPQTLRRTRFVLISDTHKCTPALPRGDVLIHAGDLTNQGSPSELSRAIQWLEKADFEAKIVVAGNHDLALDRNLHADNSPHLRTNRPSDLSEDNCISLLTSSPSITYLVHAAAQIRLTSPKGPRTTFKVFASPYSPRNARHGIFSAFTYSAPASSDLPPAAQPRPQDGEEGLPRLWDDIPLDTDVVVTHTPPRTHCDRNRDGLPAGCEALRRAMWRIRPRLAVCGHVHEARGAERVLWDLGCSDVPFREARVRRWEDPDPAGKKMSLVNLTAKGGDALRNDGSHCHPAGSASASASVSTADSADVKGLGGDASPDRSDQIALQGRLGRQETCVVNCAVMAKSYPHVGGRTMNKPIVVDLDLPTWDP